jgi:hypothetical protein
MDDIIGIVPLNPLNYVFITTIIIGLIICTFIYLPYLIRKQKLNVDTRILKLLQMFTVVIALIATIGGLISLILVYHKEWWYGEGADVTNLAGRFWFYDFPVNLTVTKESTPLLKDPAWWSVIIGIPAALAVIIGFFKVQQNLDRLVNQVTISNNLIRNEKNYTLNLEQKVTDPRNAETSLLSKKEAVDRDLENIYATINKIKKNIEHAEMHQPPNGGLQVQPWLNIDELDNQYKKIARDLEKLRTHIGNLKDSYDALINRHWWQFWQRG